MAIAKRWILCAAQNQKESVGISYGRAIYQMQIIGGGLLYLESIPLLDHYFAPVWPLAPMQRRIGYWLYEFNEGEKDHE